MCVGVRVRLYPSLLFIALSSQFNDSSGHSYLEKQLAGLVASHHPENSEENTIIRTVAASYLFTPVGLGLTSPAGCDDVGDLMLV